MRIKEDGMAKSATDGLTVEQRGRFRRYCEQHRLWHPDVHRRLAQAIGESPRAEENLIRELSTTSRAGGLLLATPGRPLRSR